MSLDPDELTELKDIFKLEAADHLQTFSTDLGLLKGLKANSAAIDRLHRAAHSLKGAARMLGLEEIDFLAAEMETRLGQVKRYEIEVNPALLSELYLTLNRLRLAIDSNEAELPLSQTLLVQPSTIDKIGTVDSRTQVETERSDELLLITSELETALTPQTLSNPELLVARRILVVDDSLTTRTLEKNILEAAGYQVTLVNNGVDALEKLLTEEPFELVIADVQMPQMDGFELTETIRRHKRIPNQLPVVLLTSLADEASRQRGMLAGANAYLTKGSFDQLEFLKTIRQFI